jgi:hypothetical protein
MNGSLKDSYPVSIGTSIATRLGKSCVLLGGAPKGLDVPVIWVLAMLKSSKVSLMKEITPREGVDDSDVSRMVNLTTLATDVVAIRAPRGHSEAIDESERPPTEVPTPMRSDCPPPKRWFIPAIRSARSWQQR